MPDLEPVEPIDTDQPPEPDDPAGEDTDESENPHVVVVA